MRRSILLACGLCLSALPFILSSPQACSTQLSVQWLRRVFYCQSDPECYHCPLKYTQCVAEYPSHSEDSCNVCIESGHVQLEHHINALNLKECFLQSKESTKIVVMKLEDHKNCGPIQNKSETFSKTWLSLLKKHLVSNIMVDTVTKKVMLFRINYKNGRDFPCVKQFNECGIPEADILPHHLDSLYECMKCSCPTEHMNKVTTNKKQENHVSTEAIVGAVVGGVLFLVLVAGSVFFLVRYWRSSRMDVETGVDLNPVYGDYSDPDYVAEVLDQNDYYAAPDDVEDNGVTMARDNNSLYGHSE